MSIIKRGELNACPHKLREIAPSGINSDGFEALFPQESGGGLYYQKNGASFPKIDKSEGPVSAGDPDTVAQKQLKLFAELIERNTR